MADDTFRPRAISLVLFGGVAAAIFGPTLGQFGAPLLAPPYLGSYLIVTAIAALAFVLLAFLKVPSPTSREAVDARARPLFALARQPVFLVALFGAASGYGVMILAMTATPIAMITHQHSLGNMAMVIQMHVLAMFLPAFFTGSLITRFGTLPIMFIGVVFLSGHVVASLSGTGFTSFASALVMVGLGWNFLYIGGTTLLTRAYNPAERGSAQGVNDFAVVAVNFAASFAAGALLQALGWQLMNLVLVPWLALAAAAILWLVWRERGMAVAAKAG